MMKIGLMGYGVVGSGADELAALRDDMKIQKILLRSDKPAAATRGTKNAEDILNDPEIDTVIEVMGGLHPAYEYVCAALTAGKNVVTANKALIAAYYEELTALAAAHHVALRCTAAVGGGIPWLVNLARCRRIDRITSVGGIMNGTTNFIMTAMEHGGSFAEILKKAQELGYAEADPTADIDGWDIRRKLVISAAVAFDARLREEDIPMFGIRTVTAEDVSLFLSRGYSCRLIASAAMTTSGISACIEPTLLGPCKLESAAPSNYNLITFDAEKIGRQSFFGQGAGKFPTAYNVISDCLDILGGKKAFYSDASRPAKVDNSSVTRCYFVRTTKPDAFLSSVTAAKWESGIVTSAVRVVDMHEWAAKQKNIDAGFFMAGIR